MWAAFDPVSSSICIDTEGLLGVTNNQFKRTRLLLKVLAVSDVVIYRTCADRLHTDLFQVSDLLLPVFTDIFMFHRKFPVCHWERGGGGSLHYDTCPPIADYQLDQLVI